VDAASRDGADVTTDAVRRALDAVTDLFDALGLDYALVGGLAVSIWGAPRATADVDVYADLRTDRRDEIHDEMTRRGFDVPAMAEELQRFGVFRSLFRPTNVFVDVFDADNPLGEAILARRRRVIADGKARWAAAPEELVLLKAFSDRPRDFDDLTTLVAVCRDLDATHVDRWVRELDRSIGGDEVSERLRRAREAAAKRSTE
jgi:hypothetical protein